MEPDTDDTDTTATTTTATLGFNVADEVHTGFVDVLRQLSTETWTPEQYHRVPVRKHPLFLSMVAQRALDRVDAEADTTSVTVQRQTLPLVTRHEEETWLRLPTQDDDVPCCRGTACEGHAVAAVVTALGAYDEGTSPPVAATLVAFRPRDDLQWHRCVMCLRKDTAVAFYTAQARHEPPLDVVQPYRNHVRVPGEYRLAACLWPNASGHGHWEGISDPFVRHQRHQYAWHEDHYVHRPSVLYRQDDDDPTPYGPSVPSPLFRPPFPASHVPGTASPRATRPP